MSHISKKSINYAFFNTAYKEFIVKSGYLNNDVSRLIQAAHPSISKSKLAGWRCGVTNPKFRRMTKHDYVLVMSALADDIRKLRS